MHSAAGDAAVAEFLLLPGVEGAGGKTEEQRRFGMLLRCVLRWLSSSMLPAAAAAA